MRAVDQPDRTGAVNAQDLVAPGQTGVTPGPEPRLGGAAAEVQVDFGPGHLPLVFAVRLVDQQLGVGILEAGHKGFGRPFVEVSLAQGIDVVVIDGTDDFLEEPRLLIDPAPRRRPGTRGASRRSGRRSPRWK